jgi:hypothetical protein
VSREEYKYIEPQRHDGTELHSVFFLIQIQRTERIASDLAEAKNSRRGNKYIEPQRHNGTELHSVIFNTNTTYRENRKRLVDLY